MFGGTADGDTETDTQAIVVGVAQNEGFLGEFGCVFGDHVGVHHEPARGDHHGFGPNRAGVTETLP